MEFVYVVLRSYRVPDCPEVLGVEATELVGVYANAQHAHEVSRDGIRDLIRERVEDGWDLDEAGKEVAYEYEFTVEKHRIK